MKQQTAIDWLVKEFNLEEFKATIEFAKAMEKEQMYKCASFWRGKENEIEKPIFDEYYNETYNK